MRETLSLNQEIENGKKVSGETDNTRICKRTLKDTAKHIDSEGKEWRRCHTPVNSTYEEKTSVKKEFSVRNFF